MKEEHKNKEAMEADSKKQDADENPNKPGIDEQIKIRDEKIALLTDQLQRVAADFDNYKKRICREHEEFKKRAAEKIIENILPVLDNLELAMRNTKDPDELVKGVKMIHSQIVQTLEKEGVHRIDCLNKEFDPHKHEALISEKSEKDNLVLEEIQPGYTMNDRVLRHSKVKVGKKDKQD